mgnify:CR=1 FL=1
MVLRVTPFTFGFLTFGVGISAGMPSSQYSDAARWNSASASAWLSSPFVSTPLRLLADDSKATNPHAAQSSLQTYDPVVWIAGGLAKGARFDDLVTAARDRLRGVVLLGRDRGVIADALSRHAPDVPVIVIEGGDTSVMDRVVRAAADLARPGDTVLLAPGCASMDMFANYGARGDAFAEAVLRMREQ